MYLLTENKRESMKRLSNENGIIAALAIDQRGALQKMISAFKTSGVDDTDIINFKKLVSEELTGYSSSILLDPEFGLPASTVRDENAGLLLAYEKTGYDANKKGRLPDLINIWSALRLKEAGADAVKFLLYYDIDEAAEINDIKHAFVERLGAECAAEDIPFYLELVSYASDITDASSKAYAQVKPHKVIKMMAEFSKPRYGVDVLKVEVPVNMKFVEGYSGEDEWVYTREEAANFFKQQAESTPLPFIFLSAGVSASLFQETLRFARASGSTFNGVLCGRATWSGAVEPFVTKGEAAAREWLRTCGRDNIERLNLVLLETATPWFNNR